MKYSQIRFYPDKIEFVLNKTKNKTILSSIDSFLTHPTKSDFDRNFVVTPDCAKEFLSCLKNTAINMETLEPHIIKMEEGPELEVAPTDVDGLMPLYIPVESTFSELINHASSQYFYLDRGYEDLIEKFVNGATQIITDHSIKVLTQKLEEEKLESQKGNE